MGRIEPPLLLLFTAVLFKEQVDRWAVSGTVMTIIGALVIFALQYLGDSMALGLGELQAALAAVAMVVATLLSKLFLNRVPLGIFTVLRTAVGTLVFFAAVVYLFGFRHFQDVFSPFLWKWMLVYGAVIVVAGQLSWFKGIATTSASQVSLANSFTPVAGVIFAVLLLGGSPDMAVLVGGAIIVFGIVVAQLGFIVGRHSTVRRTLTSSETVKLEGGVNFKGV